ncbi:TFIIB-domain-containing protein [Metschnikowia bicuspidata]|uniref:B-related factor 1 n=1 Tax=Metschnikowia bicuspidata TaxID=27322 RepID=A0A4P9ZF19_9ASCO|nr:TFIIB-domain-containing protein [Metschnikowia bicuspidata]
MSARPRERKCLNCGCTRLTRDQLSSAGDLVCEECGMVQEENPIVSEVQFGESSSGAAVVQGSMVGPNQTRAYSQGSALESKQQTLMNARTQMKKIALEMKIPDYIVNSAVGWFTLALNKNFVKGRRSQNVLAACLYVACRKVRTHHLLIDFSSRAQISVYSLGATFLKLVRLLDITKLEPVDTSLFIQHFAEKLGFGDQTTKVCKDATALAQRMSADWICHGRRPAGIAGACLLLAARMNNFQRSHAEVVAVAHVAEETIQKRLNEFKKTSSAKFTVLGFREAVTDSKYFSHTDAKPPAINRNNEIEKKVQKVLRQRTRTLERFRELAKNRKLLSTLDSMSSGHLGSLSHVCVPQTQNEDQDADDDEEREAKEDELLKAILDGGSLNEKDLEKTLDMILKRDIPRVENSVNYKDNDDIQKIIQLRWPRNLIKSSPTSLDILKKVRDDEELDELDDDDEVNDVKLSPEEIKEKEQMWISINHDFLIAQEKKRLKVEADELAGSASGQYKKRRATPRAYSKFEPRKQEPPNRSITPAESSRQMLEKKHFSKKINYDHLPNLFTENLGN